MQSTEGPRIAQLPQRKIRTETSDLERHVRFFKCATIRQWMFFFEDIRKRNKR